MDVKNKIRFSFKGEESKDHFSNCFLNSTTLDGRLIAINDKYLALSHGIRGNIKLFDASKPQPINLIENAPTIESENSNILDMEFSPFDSNILCFSNENGHVFISRINNESENNFIYISKSYEGHDKKVNFLNFNPIASNIIVSSTTKGDIHVWESKEYKTYIKFRAHSPNTILWSPNGDLIGVSTKNIMNKFLTIYDPRNKNEVCQNQIYQEAIITKFAWLDNNTVVTVGNDNEDKNKIILNLLDIRKNNKSQNKNNPFSTIEIDKYKSEIIPFVNPELKLIYCVGKKENSIKIFDYWDGSLHKINEFKASEQNIFSVMLNRKYLNKSKNEIDRFARYTNKNNIFFVNFNFLPGQNLDGILYPKEEFLKPQIDSNDWINNKNPNKTKFIHYKRFTYRKSNNFMTEETSINNDNKTNPSNLKIDNSKLNQENNVQNLFHTPKKSYSNNSHKDLNNIKSNKEKLETTRKKLTSQKSYISNNKQTIYNEPKKIDEKLENQIKELESKLIEKDKEINEYKLNISKINEENNRLKLLISKNEKQYKDLVKDHNQKEERASKNIGTLKTQINEKIKDIINFRESIKNKDIIIKEKLLKIKSLEEEKTNYLKENNEIKQRYELILKKLEDKLNINSAEEMIFEYEKKILLLKQQLKKNYEDEMTKKIEVIKHQYEENIFQLLNNIEKNLIKIAEIKLKDLKDKYNNIFSTKEVELNQKCNEITKFNRNIKEKEIYYNKLDKENINLKNQISKYPFTLLENEYIILLIILTKDEKIIFPLMCKNTDKFHKIEEIFFKEFPEYSKKKGNFYIKNNNLLSSDESLEKYKIKPYDIIIFSYT